MRSSLRKRSSLPEPGVVAGSARVDPRTKGLTKRLKPGDIAVIDHEDLDRVSAEALVACQPVAVLNAARSTSGRYPNLGPEILVGAGIPLIDDLGPDVMAIVEGHRLRIVDGSVYEGDELVAEGVEQTAATVALAMEEARAGLSVQLESFAANTMDYLRRERDLLLDGVGVPDIDTVIDGRQVLIVVRGYHYKEDLVTLRPYIREYRPVLIGVDGGADAILDAGWRPDLIVGDMDSVSDRALGCGAEVVVHAYRDGRAPGLARVEQLGVPHVVFPATGTSEDVAMLLADDKGAELIVAVGTHFNLIEFLERNRSGMSSTFLTRLRVGEILIDAKGVSRLVSRQVGLWPLFAFAFAGLGALVVAVLVSPQLRSWFELMGLRLRDLLGF
jgi:uncharacterized membrane-anchored protein